MAKLAQAQFILELGSCMCISDRLFPGCGLFGGIFSSVCSSAFCNLFMAPKHIFKQGGGSYAHLLSTDCINTHTRTHTRSVCCPVLVAVSVACTYMHVINHYRRTGWKTTVSLWADLCQIPVLSHLMASHVVSPVTSCEACPVACVQLPLSLILGMWDCVSMFGWHCADNVVHDARLPSSWLLRCCRGYLLGVLGKGLRKWLVLYGY